MAEIRKIPASTIGIFKREFNLKNLEIIAATGVNLAKYQSARIPPTKGNDYNPYENEIETGPQKDKELYKSKIGTPVYTNLTIEAGSYTDDLGNTKNFPKIVFDTVLLTVTMSKNIVKTSIQGRPGTIKQSISLGDYEVNINAIVPGDNGVYPFNAVADIKSMLEAPIALTVSSRWLQIWDVNQIVIDSFEVPQNPGGYSYQNFTIKGSSDSPIELEVISPG
jgi:hypothetical protein